MADLYYYETGYIDDKYFVYTADAAAALSAPATVSCSAGIIKVSAVSLSAQFSQTAVGSRTKDIDLFAFSQANIAVQVDRIRDNNVSTSTVFSVATDASRILLGSSDDYINSSLTADNTRVKFIEAAVDAAFSLTAELTRVSSTVTGSGTWSSEFTVDCQAQRKKNIIDCDVVVTATVTATGNRIRFSASDELHAEAFVTAHVNYTADHSAALSSESLVSATISHIEGADLQAFANASLIVDANVIKDLSSNISSAASTIIDAARIRDNSISITVTATQITSIDKIRSGLISILSQATLSADVSRTKFGQADIISSTTTAIDVSRIRDYASAVSTQASIAALATNIKLLAATISTLASVTAVIGRSITGQSQLISQATLFANRYAGNGRPRQWSVTNSLSYSNSIKQYGTHSLWLNAGTDYAFSEASGEFLVRANENFVFEMWVYKNGDPTFSVEPTYAGVGWLQNNNSGRDMRNFSSTNDHWAIGSNFTNRLQFKYNNGGTVQTITTTQTVAASSWFHVAIRRTGGNTLQLLYNNSVVGTATFSGAFQIPSNSSYSRLGIFNGLGSSPTNMYYDEISYKIGSDQIDGYTGVVYNDPTTQVILLHLDNNLTDDISVTAFAQANLSASATASATATKAVLAISALNATATQSASIQVIRSASASLSAQGFEVIAANRIQQFAASLNTSTALTALVGPLRSTSASLTSSSTVSASGQRIRFGSAAFTAFNTELLTGSRIRSVSAVLTASATVSTSATGFRRTSAALASATNITASGIALEGPLNVSSWMYGLRDTVSDVSDPVYRNISLEDFVLDETNQRIYELNSFNLWSTDQLGSTIVVRDSRSGDLISSRDIRFNFGSGTDPSAIQISNLCKLGDDLYWTIANFSTTWRCVLYKLNLTTDTLSGWRLDLSAAEKITTDGTNLYVGGWQTASAGAVNAIVLKLTTTGSQTWKKIFPRTGSQNRCFGVAYKDSWLYAAITYDGTFYTRFVKMDASTGAVDSIKEYALEVDDLKLDANSNLWFKGRNRFGQLNTDLTITNTKLVNYSGSALNLGSIAIDTGNNLVYANAGNLLFRANYVDNTVSWVSNFIDSSVTSFNLEDATPQIVLDSQTKFYWTVPSIDKKYNLTLLGKNVKLSGEQYFDSVAYKDGNTGTWSYSRDTSNQLALAAWSLTAINGTDNSTSSGTATLTADSNSQAVTIGFADYLYVYGAWGSGSLTSTATTSVSALRIRSSSVTLQTASTISATATIIKRAGAALSTTSTQTTLAVKTARTGSSLQSTATQVTAIRRNRFGSATLSSAATVAATAAVTRRTVIAVTSTATAAALGLRIRPGSAQLPSIATELTVAYKNATGSITLESRATVTATTQNSRTRRLSASLNTAATVVADVENVVGFKVDLAAATGQTTTGQRIRFGTSGLSVTATTAASADRTRGLTAQFTASSAVAAATELSRQRNASAAVTANSSLAAQTDRVRPAAAQLTSQVTSSFFINRIVRITADLTTQGFILAVGDVIKIDPFLQLEIESETRYLLILPESRILDIESETRTLTIEGI